MTFETPCGLLVKGSHFTSGNMSWRGVRWQPENDNPVVCCPRFDLEFCAMRHPQLWGNHLNSRSGITRQCACHQTDRPYTYEGSLDEAHDRVWAESEEIWKSFKVRHRGRICKHQCYYDRTAKEWHTLYNPIECANGYGGVCRYCSILGKELDTRRGNVFYDVKETRTVKGDWHLSAADRGRKRLLLFTGMEFYASTSVPAGLLEIRDGFEALNRRLENELRGGGKVLQLPAINTAENRKEAA